MKTVKNIFYILGAILMIYIILKLAISLLIGLLPLIILVCIYFAIKKIRLAKINKDLSNSYDDSVNEFAQEYDIEGETIDVEFEEVKK